MCHNEKVDVCNCLHVQHYTLREATLIPQTYLPRYGCRCTRSMVDGERLLCENWRGGDWGERPRLLCASSERRLRKLLEAQPVVVGVPLHQYRSNGSQDALLIADVADHLLETSFKDAVTGGSVSPKVSQLTRKRSGGVSHTSGDATPAAQWAWHRGAEEGSVGRDTTTPAMQWAWHRGSDLQQTSTEGDTGINPIDSRSTASAVLVTDLDT